MSVINEGGPMKSSVLAILCLLLCPIGALGQEGQQQFAVLGDFRLESGEQIRDCRLGYRTFGRLNSDKSNVVLVPTWFAGTTSDFQLFFGSGKLIDASIYFIVAIDALGNGVSTSPSNCSTCPMAALPLAIPVSTRMSVTWVSRTGINL